MRMTFDFTIIGFIVLCAKFNVSAIHRPGWPSLLINQPEKHTFGKGHWYLLHLHSGFWEIKFWTVNDWRTNNEWIQQWTSTFSWGALMMLSNTNLEDLVLGSESLGQPGPVVCYPLYICPGLSEDFILGKVLYLLHQVLHRGHHGNPTLHLLLDTLKHRSVEWFIPVYYLVLIFRGYYVSVLQKLTGYRRIPSGMSFTARCQPSGETDIPDRGFANTLSDL